MAPDTLALMAAALFGAIIVYQFRRFLMFCGLVVCVAYLCWGKLGTAVPSSVSLSNSWTTSAAPSVGATSPAPETNAEYREQSELLGVPTVNPIGEWTYHGQHGEDEALLNKITTDGEVTFAESGEYVERVTTQTIPKGRGQPKRLVTITLRGHWATGETADAIGCKIESFVVERVEGVPLEQATAAGEALVGPCPMRAFTFFDGLTVRMRNAVFILEREATGSEL